MNDEIGRLIDKMIGEVKDCDVQTNGIAWGQALRVNVEMDIQKPIQIGRTINLLGNKIWIPLTYEKLPRICFKCGKIFHRPQGFDRKDYKTNKQYGTWLRVDCR